MLYIPRRHRRKLLLPPGLLALAFLLLVGCGVLGSQSRLRRYSIIQLAVPDLCGQPNRTLKTICVSSASKLESKHKWHFIDLTGNNANDSSSSRLIQDYFDAVPQHPDSIASKATTGLAIRFYNKSRYASLIWVLDYLDQSDDKRRYFFHIYSPIPTIYVLPRFG